MSWWRRTPNPENDAKIIPANVTHRHPPNAVILGTECADYSRRSLADPVMWPCWNCGHITCTPGWPCDICALTVRLEGEPDGAHAVRPDETPDD